MEDGYQSGSPYDLLREQIAGLLPGRASETAPFIATLLGIEPTGEDRERVRYLQPPQLRGQIFKAAADLFEALASACPLLVVFEDIHWIDPSSLDLLEELMALTDRMPLMLLAVLRPQRQEASWRFHDGAQRDYTHRYTSVALEPLDADNSRTLVANLLHVEDLPLKVRNLILTKAEGNPFFVEEVIRSLLDAELVVQQNSHWRATQEIENISVPDTLAGVINARLDRLDDGSKQGALTASVIGREFDFDTLADVHDVGQAIDSVLTDLQRRELIREQSRQPQRVYLFQHALTQETAYASLLMSRRRELHLRVAEYMERVAPERVNEVARHFLEAREDERALPYVVEAGDLAAKAYSTADAIARYSQALEILETVENPQLARRAYEGLGGALTSAFDVQGAIDNYQSMLAEAQAKGDMPMQVSALNKIAFVTGLMQGQTVKADEHLANSERLANQCSDFAGLTELHTIYCYIKTAHAEFDEAYGHLAEAAEIGERLNLEEPRLFGLVHTANTLTYMTRFDEAWEAAEKARQVAEELGNRKWQAELLALTTPFYHMRNGDLDRAAAAAEKGMNLAADIGAADNECEGAMMLGKIAWMRGDYERAIALSERSVDAARKSGFTFLEAAALCVLGTTYLDISDELADKTGEYHGAALEVMERPLGAVMGPLVWAELAYCAMQLGGAEEAGEFIQKGLGAPSSPMYLMRPQLLLGSAALSLGGNDAQGARESIREAREFAEERAMKHYYPMISFFDAMAVAGEDPDGALEGMAKAEELAAEMQMRPLVWQARAFSAQVLDGMGRAAEAEGKRAGAREMIGEIASLFQDEDLRSKFVESATKKVG